MSDPAIPECLEHGLMEPLPPRTSDMAYLGTWHQCMSCSNSTLFASPELIADLNLQRKTFAKPQPDQPSQEVEK